MPTIENIQLHDIPEEPELVPDVQMAHPEPEVEDEVLIADEEE